MDADTVKTIVELGEHGGSVAMLIAVFLAGRASRTATEAVENLKAIRAGLEAGFKAMGRHNRDTEEKLKTIHEDIQQLPLRALRNGR